MKSRQSIFDGFSNLLKMILTKDSDCMIEPFSVYEAKLRNDCECLTFAYQPKRDMIGIRFP